MNSLEWQYILNKDDKQYPIQHTSELAHLANRGIVKPNDVVYDVHGQFYSWVSDIPGMQYYYATGRIPEESTQRNPDSSGAISQLNLKIVEPVDKGWPSGVAFTARREEEDEETFEGVMMLSLGSETFTRIISKINPFGHAGHDDPNNQSRSSFSWRSLLAVPRFSFGTWVLVMLLGLMAINLFAYQLTRDVSDPLTTNAAIAHIQQEEAPN